ncbi:helix-turn-helix domain-containing GNAT family N-acetyltransferase [Roseomonas sp. OT10]|uniref:bifunctional helix-turn-helix transcriptional regulator/GNAT family N-acetyltransferase n=1 Tax=Roseomonas cutis TaxID=2897332 RepID=UPI001E5BF973|nr:helix-turn-helix domain-containing GNAT family N-acetyltransferase [Roseomonas sp. OT10]UFN47743.1 helix-turn-helix domain-containing GNAT family N-acetyltransferase [Roseomonas sp. OT10]
MDLVEPVRNASRRLVRELGFLRGSLAGTPLPPSAVHALLEIAAAPAMTAGGLCELLRLEKSSVSRMLRKLVQAGLVEERPEQADGRTKRLALTPSGRERAAQIDGFARRQVAAALDRLEPRQRGAVATGLALYADALAGGAALEPAPGIAIVAGHRPGALAACAGLHARHYARTAGFGRAFEALVAAGLAEFSGRLDRPGNGFWLALRGEDVLGTVAIDGEDLGPGLAHLRWFIVAEAARGAGLGRRLLSAALRCVDDGGFRETHLWTFRGLDAARHLYEAAGFALAEERPGRQWGEEVLEQRFVRRLGAGQGAMVPGRGCA